MMYQFHVDSMNQILVFYITHPTKEHALRVVDQLLEEKLIACGNIFPIMSEYIWQAKKCSEGEFVSILKSTISLESRLEERIEVLHEYEVPCIIRTKFSCNRAYANWVADQTKQ